MPRIFISYARKDGAAFATELRQTLKKEGFSVWQDITALAGGRDWWTQIEETLRSRELEHFVLVVTPAALASQVIHDEILLARQEGKTVSPIRGTAGIGWRLRRRISSLISRILLHTRLPELPEFHALPRWCGQLYDLDIPEHRDKLLCVLKGPSTQARVPMMAPKPPADFVARPREFDPLKAKLLNAKGDAVAITVALKGASGYGKTTLAQKLAHDEDIQQAYFDGVLWAELGEKLGNVETTISSLINCITGELPAIANIHDARTKLVEALGKRRFLLVIDDVWREQDLKPFLEGGQSTTQLITTRINTVLPLDVAPQPIDAMQANEALDLLVVGLPREQAAAQHAKLVKLTMRLGMWPQLLKLVNGFLRDRVVRCREPLAEALVDSNGFLDEAELVGGIEDYRTKAVAQAINLNLGRLDEKQRHRFAELAVFPEGTQIPVGVVARLWQETAGVDERWAKDLLARLHDLSLLLNLDLEQKTLRLHDTVRHFLRGQAGKDALAMWHKRLLTAMGGMDRPESAGTDAQRYFCLYLPHHLEEAGESEALDALLLDPEWIEVKLGATGLLPLLADYNIHAPKPYTAQGLIRRALVSSIEILSRDPRQLFPQLLGRLMAEEQAELRPFTAAATRRLRPPALITTRPSLMPPGAETAHLIPHSGSVSALAALPDDQLVCGSEDGDIRQWDWVNGTRSALFSDQTAGIWALAWLRHHGLLAAGFNDGVIRLIDVAGGGKIVPLGRHEKRIRGLAELHDGRLASGGFDGTIRLWNIGDRCQTFLAKGESGVTALAVMPDQPDRPLASGSQDGVICLWDTSLASPKSTVLTKSHRGWVWALTWLPDGRLASGSQDGICLWDVNTGAEKLLGVSGESIRSLTVLSDGRLVSGSDDGIVRVWDLASEARARLGEHSRRVNVMVALGGDRVASGSQEGAVRIWDTSLAEPVQHENEKRKPSVTALATLPGGKLASGTDDGVIGIWDTQTTTQITQLQSYQGQITAFAVLPNGNLASGLADGTVTLWTGDRFIIPPPYEDDRPTGNNRIKALAGLSDGRLAWGREDGTIGSWRLEDSTIASNRAYQGEISAIAELRDHRLAVGFRDGTLMLWDAEIRAQTCLRGRDDTMISALAILTDDRLAFASGKIIKLWDIANGAELTLDGHTESVSAICLLPCGYLAPGSNDGSIRIWDVTRNSEIARLDVDFPVSALVAPPTCNKLVAGDSGGRLHWLDLAGFEPPSYDTAPHPVMVASKMTTLPTSSPSKVGM